MVIHYGDGQVHVHGHALRWNPGRCLEHGRASHPTHIVRICTFSFIYTYTYMAVYICYTTFIVLVRNHFASSAEMVRDKLAPLPTLPPGRGGEGGGLAAADKCQVALCTACLRAHVLGMAALRLTMTLV